MLNIVKGYYENKTCFIRMKCSVMDIYRFANHLVKLLFCIYFSYCLEVGLCYDCLEKDHGSDGGCEALDHG